MAEFREMLGTIRVPANTGIDGFLHTVRTLLKKPRIQSIEIDARGNVKFRRFVTDSDEDEAQDNYGVHLDELTPYYIIRNARVVEYAPPTYLSAAVIVGLMFDKAAKDQMHPLAFVCSPDSRLWSWYSYTTGHFPEVRSAFFGLPVLSDRHIPETALLLCAGFGRDAAFVDTQVSYKVEIPAIPAAEVTP